VRSSRSAGVRSARNEPGSRELMPTTLKGPRRSVAPGNDHESATRCVHNSLLVEPGLRHGGTRRVRSAGRPASTAFMGNGVAAGGGPGARRPPRSGGGAGQSAALPAGPRTSPAPRGGGGGGRENPGGAAGGARGRGGPPPAVLRERRRPERRSHGGTANVPRRAGRRGTFARNTGGVGGEVRRTGCPAPS